MGGCSSSVSKSREEEEKSKLDNNNSNKMMTKLRLAFFSPKNKGNNHFIIISSPVKDTFNHNRSITLRSDAAQTTGSKEESFFDSKAWLDSDCDDDFLSVKGDFTPSQGNTPVHHNFSTGTTLQVNKGLFNDSSPEPSPNTKKKRLSELFKESLREDEGVDFEDQENENTATTKVENKGTTMLKEKTVKSSQCCLPMMISNRSFNDRSKMSTAQSVG